VNQKEIPPQRAAATGTERLILYFHGVGLIPDWSEPGERNYCCDEHRFAAILDPIRSLSQVVPIDITFDDGNISDALIALPALLHRGQRATFSFVGANRSAWISECFSNERPRFCRHGNRKSAIMAEDMWIGGELTMRAWIWRSTQLAIRTRWGRDLFVHERSQRTLV